MTKIDMFIHPVAVNRESALHDLSQLDWNDWFAATRRDMDKHQIATSGVCVMDDGILDRSSHLKQLEDAASSGRFFFTLMPDIRRENVAERIRIAASAGFRGLTFHSYLQEITQKDYAKVSSLAQFGETLELFTGLCTAYGSKKLFDFHSLPLAAEVAEAVTSPVFLYHNGGARVLEAMLMCEMWPNLYLETSFSLPYWMGSSIEQDLAFSIKKIGANRVLFGSDSPFQPLETALREHSVFFTRHSFSREEQALILGETARSLLPFLASS